MACPYHELEDGGEQGDRAGREGSLSCFTSFVTVPSRLIHPPLTHGTTDHLTPRSTSRDSIIIDKWGKNNCFPRTNTNTTLRWSLPHADTHLHCLRKDDSVRSDRTGFSFFFCVSSKCTIFYVLFILHCVVVTLLYRKCYKKYSQCGIKSIKINGSAVTQTSPLPTSA